ncbi:MAG TPA: hypothetical protein PLX35_09765 [Cyclobacteriaceae bacterium]|nr:hypothetical protein [Cyclobacteriaceae bacterium]
MILVLFSASMTNRNSPISVILLLSLILQSCSDSPSPHKVLVHKITDNFGTTTDLTYNANNQITAIEKTINGKTTMVTLIYQGDSVIIDSGTDVTVVQLDGKLPIREYTALKSKPGSPYYKVNYQNSNGVPVSRTSVAYAPIMVPDSTVIKYVWTAGNLTQYSTKSYQQGNLYQQTWNNTFDTGNNFTNGDYLFSWALAFEGSIFSMCRNNLVSTAHADNSLTICCYQFQYNSNHYPSNIKGVQADAYTLDYREPNE